MTNFRFRRSEIDKVPSVSSTNQIEFMKLGFTYNPKTTYSYEALKNVSLRLNGLEIIGITGSTGCGKTTLIKHINGLLIPTKGQITTHGHMITNRTRRIRDVKDLRQKVSLVFQYAENQLFEDTVLKDIIFGPIQFGVPREEAEKRARRYLKMVGLNSNFLHRSPFNLSGGEKRRVAVAGVLAIQAITLVLDEPTAGLDPQGVSEMLNIFQNLIAKNKQKRIIIVGHNLDHFLAVCNRLVVLNDGKVVADDEPVKILKDKLLIKKLGLMAPMLYQFIDKLTARGLDLSQFKIKTIDDLAQAIKTKIKT